QMPQAVGTVARDLQVDGDVAADVGDQLEVQPGEGQPFGQDLHRQVEPEVVGQPVPAHDHRSMLNLQSSPGDPTGPGPAATRSHRPGCPPGPSDSLSRTSTD